VSDVSCKWLGVQPSPLSPEVHFWSYPVFEAAGYGEIQRGTARYSYRYVRIQPDDTVGVGYIGVHRGPICCKIELDTRYRSRADTRDTKDTVRYRRDTEVK